MAKKKTVLISKKTEDKKEGGALFIPAGLFLGFGYGFMTGNIPAGLFGGMGLGFLLYGLVTVFKK